MPISYKRTTFPQAHSGIQLSTSQALSLYLSPKISAELRMLLWCFTDHKYSLEQQCLLFPAYASWFPLCKLYMILRIPYQYLPILQHIRNSSFAFTKDAVSSFAMLGIFYDVVCVSLSFMLLLTLVSGYNIYGLWMYVQNFYSRRKTRSSYS